MTSCLTFSYSVPMHVMTKYNAKPQSICSFFFHSCDYNTFSFYILRMWWESKNRTESTNKWIWSLKDKFSSDFNPVDKKKILSKDNKKKSANEIKKITILVVVRQNLEFWKPYKIWLKDSRSRHFALQITFFQVSVCLSGPNLCPFKVETFLMKKTGDPLMFARGVFDKINENCRFYRSDLPEASNLAIFSRWSTTRRRMALTYFVVHMLYM